MTEKNKEYPFQICTPWTLPCSSGIKAFIFINIYKAFVVHP